MFSTCIIARHDSRYSQKILYSRRVKLRGTNQISHFLSLFSFRLVIFFNRLENLTKSSGYSGCFRYDRAIIPTLISPYCLFPSSSNSMRNHENDSTMRVSSVFAAANRRARFILPRGNAITITVTMFSATSGSSRLFSNVFHSTSVLLL